MPHPTSSARLPEDEYGVKWVVEAGDPANDSINYLKRRGMKIIVLPRKVFLYGPANCVVEWEPVDPILASRIRECSGVLIARQESKGSK